MVRNGQKPEKLSEKGGQLGMVKGVQRDQTEERQPEMLEMIRDRETRGGQ